MNNILRLKGKFQTQKGKRPGTPMLPARAEVTTDDVDDRIKQLQSVYDFWNERKTHVFPLVEVHYRTVVAKSNRIRQLLSAPGKSANDSIVGARFEPADGHDCHVITHYVTMPVIESTIADLQSCRRILERHGGTIDADGLATLTKTGLDRIDSNAGLSKTAFAQIVRDIYYVRRFDVKQHVDKQMGRALVTIYDTGRNISQTVELLNALGVDVISANLLDSTTISMTPDQYDVLIGAAPYLVAMSLKDLAQLEFEPDIAQDEYAPSIPEPGNEPIVGVIDTRFDMHAYFSEWVEYHDEIDPELGEDPSDYVHGTEVTSLIVDGPELNPSLDDGCGRFRVRHFAVAREGRNSSFAILTAIRRIVAANRDITVWNLSLGSALEVSENAISPEAAILDKLQNEYGVIFIVAGTNKLPTDDRNKPKRIGAPADSINALVVNATSILREPADYTREGPVLHFFRKPDLSCFGGDDIERMAVYKPNSIALTAGTSFAAPWITRKMAYLIHVMNLSRETAKALLIDSASGWGTFPVHGIKLGYGIVPTRIQDILTTPSNEIRFILEGSVNAFETYNWRIPVPIVNGKYPYMARATLCYLPKCDKNQGVDYTDTELDLQFGRMKANGIDPLDNNVQSDPTARTYEDDARRLYRKWDNVKHVSDIEKTRFVPRTTRGIPYWGFKIRKTERFDPPLDVNGTVGTNAGDGMRFGIVVTLRGMDGRNHYDEFKQNCQLQEEPWIVEEIDMNTNIELYREADVDIDFDDNDDA
ncbi:S8 family peptidase [Bifidobacterium sp. 82T10]|uniref:S8 family peptidase n=1 Tax=Bifidobacterium miconis TaxID=2834435 RepID=A0ABS6WHB9_9BIFI|nr:S8 family peptidase [Bifidobacterium miconis]MBW3093423.1 S8 family peptidase [Bifidobacterium miconis]